MQNGPGTQTHGNFVYTKTYPSFKRQGTETNGGIKQAIWFGNTNVLIHNVQNVKNNRIISNKGVLTRSGAVISLKFMQKSTASMATPKFSEIKIAKF